MKEPVSQATLVELKVRRDQVTTLQAAAVKCCDQIALLSQNDQFGILANFPVLLANINAILKDALLKTGWCKPEDIKRYL